jgi:transposase
MTCTDHPLPAPTAARSDDSTLFAALELSRKSWLVATNAPGEEKVSKRTIAAGDGRALLDLLAGLREKAERRIGKPVKVVVIQESTGSGCTACWRHRKPCRRSRLDRGGSPETTVQALDVDALLRTLMAWARGERRVCSMVRPPSPEDEDHRRLSREREALVKERIQHTNRIKLAAQGITDFEPLRPGHRARLDGLTTGDGRALPPQLKEEIRRQLARLDAVISDLKTVEAGRDALLADDTVAVSAGDGTPPRRCRG